MNSLASINTSDELTVSKLINRLKSAFQDEEYQEVEGILVAREDNLKIEIDHLKREIAGWKDKYGELERNHGEVALAKLEVECKLHENENELNGCQEILDEFEPRVTQLEELIDSFLRQGGSKNVAKSAPEKQPDEMKKSSENEAVSVIGEVKEEPKSSENGVLGSAHSQHEEGPHRVITKCSNVVPSQRPLDFKAGTCDKALGTSVAAGRSASERIIAIDEEIEKRVPTLFASGGVSCDEVKSVQSDGNGRRCNQTPPFPLSSKRKRDDSSSRDNSSSNGSGLSGVDRLIASLDKNVRQRTSGKRIKWESEVEMTTALIGNEVLRMSAVCALYRELHCNVKSASSCSSIKGQFEQSDALRIIIARLGRYLTDGDPQGRLKKTVEQLKHDDPEGLKNCYMISLGCSSQLYEIYEKGNDPFFSAASHLV